MSEPKQILAHLGEGTVHQQASTSQIVMDSILHIKKTMILSKPEYKAKWSLLWIQIYGY